MTNKALHIKLLLCAFVLLFLAKANAASYTVVNFGARPDGRTDSTQAFKKAWAWACGSTRPVTLRIPKGWYVVRPTVFSGPCRNRVTISSQGTILAPPNYRVLARSNVWLMFYRVNGLTLNGGKFDARGSSFWSCRRHYGYCYRGAQSVSFMACSNLVVNRLTSMNSQKTHIAVMGCNNAVFKYLYVRAPSGSPNTDGMNIQSSTGVTIYGSVFKTGDDCIALSSGTKNVLIRRVACGPGHGISIGSLGNSRYEDGVQNVTVTGVVFTKTTNGVRIKSWARPSNGFVHGVTFRNLVMRNVYNPIIIDQKYCPNNQCPRQTSGVKISKVKYLKVRGTSASTVAMSFECSPSHPCQGITLQDINLTFKRGAATSYCRNVRGSNRGTVIPRSCL